VAREETSADRCWDWVLRRGSMQRWGRHVEFWVPVGSLTTFGRCPARWELGLWGGEKRVIVRCKCSVGDRFRFRLMTSMARRRLTTDRHTRDSHVRPSFTVTRASRQNKVKSNQGLHSLPPQKNKYQPQKCGGYLDGQNQNHANTDVGTPIYSISAAPAPNHPLDPFR
jgi:hypothetical protein